MIFEWIEFYKMIHKIFGKKKKIADESLSEIKRIIIESHKLSEDRHMLHLESVKATEKLTAEKGRSSNLQKQLKAKNKEITDLKKLLTKALANNELLANKVSGSVKKATTISKKDESLLEKSLEAMKDIKKKISNAESAKEKLKSDVAKLKKSVTKKTVAKKAQAKKKVVVKKSVAKKAPAKKKTVAKKVPAKKKVVAKKKTISKKVATKKTTVKKVTKKKTAPKKKMISAKKTASKKVSA